VVDSRQSGQVEEPSQGDKRNFFYQSDIQTELFSTLGQGSQRHSIESTEEDGKAVADIHGISSRTFVDTKGIVYFFVFCLSY